MTTTQTQVTKQDVLSLLMVSLGYHSMARDVLTTSDPVRLARYAQGIKNEARRRGGAALGDRARNLLAQIGL